MTALPVFRRTLAESWRSLIGWGLGVVAALTLYLPLYPSIGATGQMADIIETLPPEMVNTFGFDQIATGAGYTQSTFFGLVGFVLLTIAAANWGTSAIAGDEEKGGLELTLAHGVGRVQLVLERTAAVLVRIAALGALAFALVLALNGPSALDLEAGHLLAGVVSWLALGVLTASIALAVGGLTGRASWATLAAAGVAVAGYALNAIGNQNADLEFLHAASPYAWAFGATPISDGWDLGGLALLGGSSLVLLVLATVGLARRDIAT